MKKWIKMLLGISIVLILSGIHGYKVWEEPIYSTEIESDGYDNIGVLNGGTIVEQQFYCPLNGMKGILVQPVLYGRTDNGTLSYTLTEVQTQEIAAEGVIDPTEWTDGEYNEIAFSQVLNSKGKTYLLQIQDDQTSSDKGISFYVTEKREKSVLKVNNQEFQGSMVLQILCKTFNIEEFIVFAGMLAYIIFFIKLLYKFLR